MYNLIYFSKNTKTLVTMKIFKLPTIQNWTTRASWVGWTEWEWQLRKGFAKRHYWKTIRDTNFSIT